MANHKSQHFIPRFYLKQFSYQNNKAQVGIAIPDKNFQFPTASIANEGTLPYFYGKDGVVEGQLNILEGKAKKLIDSIVIDGFVPRMESEEYDFLMYYTMISRQRTLLAAEIVLNSNKFIDDTLQRSNGTDEIFGLQRMSREEAVQMKLSIAIQFYPILKDLKVKILVNQRALN